MLLQKHLFTICYLVFLIATHTIVENRIMKSRKGVRKMRKTWFRKGVAPHNKGIKQEEKEQGDITQFHYIRPSHSEVSMASQDPLAPYGKSTERESNGGVTSTMVLRPKADMPLEVEQMNSDFNERWVYFILYLSLLVCK